MYCGARARVRVKKLKIEIYLNNTAKIIQIWYREQRQKLADWALNQSRLIYVTQVGAICKMQAMYRGLLVRRYFPMGNARTSSVFSCKNGYDWII